MNEAFEIAVSCTQFSAAEIDLPLHLFCFTAANSRLSLGPTYECYDDGCDRRSSEPETVAVLVVPVTVMFVSFHAANFTECW